MIRVAILRIVVMIIFYFFRTNKQEIDNHISSCIGDEVIIDDDSDEDW